MNASPPASPPLIVGIGASAGGLAAYKEFLSQMPADSGMAFVLVQHLDPHHRSALVELLAAQTTMPVAEAEDGVAIAANHVYVIPPDATLTVEDGKLALDKPAPPRAQRRPIDTFFVSLAEDQGENAICIVLAGTGSDGSQGVRAIKEHGGLALAQAEFDHHAKDGMPQSAADTGLVDEVLAIEDMPAKLAQYRSHLLTAGEHKDREGIRRDAPDHLAAICKLLRERIGHDFGQYKEKTMTRRVQRRMQVLQLDTVPEYIERLKAEPHQIELLFQELLISVTRFFRDPDAWESLQQTVIPKLLHGKGAADTLRVWVPGCATGEEVYSVAIALREARQRQAGAPQVCIFATDIDARALETARSGHYSQALPGLSPERRARWFVEDGNGYTVVKELRAMCVFSPHSLARDPPFSKIDLVLCRNVLIYMQADLQERVLRKFHYALKPEGWLFLGLSEGVSRSAQLFEAVDKKHRIYRRSEAPTPALQELSPPEPARDHASDRAPAGMTARAGEDRLDRAARRVMEKHSPAYVVIDRHHQILRFSGGETGRYLEPSAGAASLNLFSIVKKALRPTVRATVKAAIATEQAVVHGKVTVRLDGDRRAITVLAEPLEGEAGLCVVAFQDEGPAGGVGAGPGDKAGDTGIAELEQELHVTKAQLHATINELESTSEEMKSANEEYQSVNEELQSSNEELETSKEEMQSMNEELQVVNAELGNKNDRLTQVNSDLSNLLTSTEIATIFLDNDLRVKSFTAGMKELFHLRESDHGRPITDIVARLDYADLRADVRKVLRSLAPIEREVSIHGEETSFILRIRPYRTVDNVIDGVVMTFVDITERKRHEAERGRLAAIVDSSADAIIGHSLDGVITSWNAAAEHTFGYSAAEAIGQPLTMLLSKDQHDEVPVLLERLKRGEPVPPIDVTRRNQKGQEVQVSLNFSPVTDRNGAMVAASTVGRDISGRHQAEAHRQLLLHELSHRVKNTLAVVQAIAMQTQRGATSMQEFEQTFRARIGVLAHAHDLLMQSAWHGASLRDLLRVSLMPYENKRKKQWTLEGRAIHLNANATLALTMVFHELATNAAKYGALSVEDGSIEVKWQVKPKDTLLLTWRERDGPPVNKPARRGFGSKLVEEGLAYELDANVTLDYKLTGLRCSIELPLAGVAQEPAARA
ncbi:MAG TPA: chemotaxis protein CheB [Rhodanobacteraceae bacterium]|nr:chemotaxis protein CheB [Rhodanobacteraceae bacterium]